MAEDNTQIITKDAKDEMDAKDPSSKILNVSVRAWIALMFGATVCGTYAYSMAFLPSVIEEPFKTMAIGAISFYFGHAVGQSKQNN